MPNPLTRTFLERRYLTGIDLTDPLGLAFHDSQFEFAADHALDFIEKEVGVHVCDDVQIEERQDFDAGNEGDWRLITLDHRPVAAVDELEFVMGGSDNPSPVLKVPKPWIYLADANAAQVQVVPRADTDGASFVQGVVGVGLWLGGAAPIGNGQVPGFYRAKYRAGWYSGLRADLVVSQLVWTPIAGDDIRKTTVSVELNRRSNANTQFVVVGVDAATGASATETVTIGPARTLGRTRRKWTALTSVTLVNPGTLGEDGESVPYGVTDWTVCVDPLIPSLILHAAGMYASMHILNVAGDIVVGAGLQSQSTGVDGLSQSFATTNSSTNAGFGARIIQYKKDLSQVLRTLQATYGRGVTGA